MFSVNVQFCLNVLFPVTLYGIRFTGRPLENEKRAEHDCQGREIAGVRIKVSIWFFAALFCGYLHPELQKLLLFTHTHTPQTHKHVQTQIHMQTHTQTHTDTDTHTHTHTTDTQTRTSTNTYADARTHRLSQTHTHRLSHTNIQTHTHGHTSTYKH